MSGELFWEKEELKLVRKIVPSHFVVNVINVMIYMKRVILGVVRLINTFGTPCHVPTIVTSQLQHTRPTVCVVLYCSVVGPTVLVLGQ